VRLSGEERQQLETLIREGKGQARRLLKARILLKADWRSSASFTSSYPARRPNTDDRHRGQAACFAHLYRMVYGLNHGALSSIRSESLIRKPNSP
jgi:hypothetical protein